MSHPSPKFRSGSGGGRNARTVRRIGVEAEDHIADYLLQLGWTVVTRRFKSQAGEIDLIALDGDCLVFVEVKEASKGDPEARVTDEKIRRLRSAGEAYLVQNPVPASEVRFDLVTLVRGEIQHFRNAF